MTDTPSAAELMQSSHHRMLEVIQQYDLTDSRSEKKALADALLNELKRYIAMTEQAFWPAVVSVINRPDLIEEAKREIKALKALMDKLASLHIDSEHFDPTFALIAETVRAQVEVEESLILPMAKQVGTDLVKLGREMSARAEAA